MSQCATHAKKGDGVMAGACAVAIASLIPIALYQTGVVSSLPDPPCSIFDSDRITSSKAAHPLGIPDSLLGLASFGATFALIVASKRSPIAKKLLGFKLSADAGVATINAGRQIIGFGKLCSWCTGTAIAAGAMAFAGRGHICESWSGAASAARADLLRDEVG